MQHLPWQVYAVFATVVYGIMNFVYKVAAEKSCSSFHVMSVSGITVSALSFGAIVVSAMRLPASNTLDFAGFLTRLLPESGLEVLPLLLGLAMCNALFFSAGSVCKLEALQHIPANVVFPIVKLNSIFVVIIALVFFSERPSPIQYSGILCGILVVGFLAMDKWRMERHGRPRLGFVFALASACCTAISMTVGKLASTEVSKIHYIFVSYTCVAGYTLLSDRATGRRSKGPLRKAALFGSIIGTLNLIGYYTLLHAFALGPLSAVQPIFAMSIVIPILLSFLVYRERLGRNRLLALIFSVASVILLSLR